MRKLSEDRIEALALAIVVALKADGGVEVLNEGEAVGRLARRLRSGFIANPAIDQSVRRKIASLSRQVPEGSREWDLLYRQYLEEMTRGGS